MRWESKLVNLCGYIRASEVGEEGDHIPIATL